jgi:hypothetical protein
MYTLRPSFFEIFPFTLRPAFLPVVFHICPHVWSLNALKKISACGGKARRQANACAKLMASDACLFFEINDEYIKLASRLIKNLPVPLDTLVRKRVRLKLAASIKIRLHHSEVSLGGS